VIKPARATLACPLQAYSPVFFFEPESIASQIVALTQRNKGQNRLKFEFLLFT
jgi:hypothetical protein